MKQWIAALRLKTLPLALGGIILGSSLNKLSFRAEVFAYAALTAVLLQILSNLANDYGDHMKGTDRHRQDRQLSDGRISPAAMRTAIIIFVILSLASGILLLNTAFGTEWKHWFIFLGLGILSILAAVAYTVGKKAYGYHGLGDIFVFLFFGLVGILGTAYLYKQVIEPEFWFPAIAYGSLCVGVLNVNNIRDLDKDILTNKITIASKLGKQGAISYQIMLMLIAMIALVLHHFVAHYLSLAPVLMITLAYSNIKGLREAQTADDHNKLLRNLSLGSLGVAILFIIPIYI